MRIEPVSDPSDPAFAAVLAIYQASIEPSEQKPPSALAAAARDPRYHILAAFDGDEVAGFSMGFSPDAAEFWLLEYMAVDARRRGQGMGAQLFNQALKDHAKRGRPIAILEVDAVSGTPAQRDERARRLTFYQRLGCRVVEGLDYILPLAGAGDPPPMLILAHADPARRAFEKAWIERMLVRLYVDVYGQNRTDRRIAAMLAGAPDPLPLKSANQGEMGDGPNLGGAG